MIDAPLMLAIPHLPLLRLQLCFRVLSPIVLPPCRGSLWKGVLGAHLARNPMRSVNGGTLYGMLIDPRPEDCLALPSGGERPAPLVLDMPGQIEPGQTLGQWQLVPTLAEPDEQLILGLTLFGQAAALAGLVVDTLATAAKEGLGSRVNGNPRGTAELQSVSHFSPQGDLIALRSPSQLEGLVAEAPVVPNFAGPVFEVDVVTPLRLERHDGARKIVCLPNELRAPYVFSAMISRIANLAACHAGQHIDTKGFRERTQKIEFASQDLGFADQSRHSRSQERDIPLGGVIGNFSLDLSDYEDVIPWLHLAQFTHVGKGTIMGMGSLRISGAAKV